ncbi:hypothetical protein ABB05_11090 [Lederbergia galactosidilytica]|uniref:Uncharacterized protein n=1 Tax=Lederbergia galactosidilytica TaxID=217031 RepID=A0A177ZSM2_9BACI|nr:hypothetical protein ABB05_11090 [Lederbergia galactosidilytica]
MGNAHETRTKEADAEIRWSSCSEARTGQLSSRADGNKGLPLVRAGRCQANERHPCEEGVFFYTEGIIGRKEKRKI